MKKITLDFEVYERELNDEYYSGKAEGISSVMKWLESGKHLHEFLCIDKGDSISPFSHWGRIAAALGREDELHHPSSEEATCHQNSKECSTQE